MNKIEEVNEFLHEIENKQKFMIEQGENPLALIYRFTEVEDGVKKENIRVRIGEYEYGLSVRTKKENDKIMDLITYNPISLTMENLMILG